MDKTLPNRWLAVMMCVGAVLCGIQAAWLSHWVIITGFLAVFVMRDARGSFFTPHRVTLILVLLLFSYLAAALQWSLVPARGMYDLWLCGLLAIIALQLPGTAAQITPIDAAELFRRFVMVYLLAVLLLALDLCANLMLQRAIARMDWQSPMALAAVSRQIFCLVLLLWPVLHFIGGRGWRAAAVCLWGLLGALILVSDSAAGRLAFAVSTLVYGLAKLSPRAVRMVLMVLILAGLGIAVPAAREAQGIIEKSGHKIPAAPAKTSCADAWE